VPQSAERSGEVRRTGRRHRRFELVECHPRIIAFMMKSLIAGLMVNRSCSCFGQFWVVRRSLEESAPAGA
jgi:hypothetical protein